MNFSENSENEYENDDSPSEFRAKDQKLINRFHPEEDVGEIGDMMNNLNIQEKMNLNQNNFVIFL